MRILQVHNYYQQAGGEDRVLENEQRLLLRAGHHVWQYTLHNDAIDQMPAFLAASNTVWNRHVYRDIRAQIRRHSIQVVHAHNTFPLVSPSVYYAAHAENTPLVQTLHNYRLICPAATLFRDGHICEDCVPKLIPFPAVIHRCYRSNMAASAATVAMLAAHRLAGTYASKVSAYIALSEFAKNKFVEGGLPANRIRVKANCLAEDPGAGAGGGGYALFAGRLTPEKGVLTMFNAWRKLNGRVNLKIAGDGPLAHQTREQAAQIPGVCFLGNCQRERLFELMRHAEALIFPSEWFEGSPMAVIEALACGTPVIAGALGALDGIVIHGVNGTFFPAGNVEAMADCVDKAFGPADELRYMRAAARRSFENHFHADNNLRTLLTIYEEATAAPVR